MSERTDTERLAALERWAVNKLPSGDDMVVTFFEEERPTYEDPTPYFSGGFQLAEDSFAPYAPSLSVAIDLWLDAEALGRKSICPEDIKP